MFTSLIKDVDGRKTERYFKRYDNAEKAMVEDINSCNKTIPLALVKCVNKTNIAKGFHERYEIYKSDKGETFTWSLVENYFED